MRKTPKPPRRLRRRESAAGPYAPGFDVEAASRVARLVAVIRVDGVPTPLVEPIVEPPSHLEFDRALTRAGVKRFAREKMTSDWDMLPEGTTQARDGARAGHVLVEEIGPGARRRLPLVVVLEHELN